MNKDLKLTKVVPWGENESYKDAICRHLEEITPELLASEPNIMFVASMSSEGMSYHILTDNSTLEVVGAFEILKNYFIADHVGE